MYNLGLVLKAEGNYDDATDTLYRAVWDYEYASAAYYQLAQISSMKGNSGKAIHEAQMAVAYNGMNIDAKNLLATLLRYSGKKAEAKSIAEEVVKLDPLNYYATRELVMMGAKPEAELKSLLRGTSESYVELALYYMNNGFMDDTQEILEDAEIVRAYPTVEYYLGYLADLKGDKTTAEKWFKKAESGSIDYVFPFRLERHWNTCRKAPTPGTISEISTIRSSLTRPWRHGEMLSASILILQWH